MRTHLTRPLAALAVAASLLVVPQAGAAIRTSAAASHVGLEGVAAFDHVVVLTEENEAAATTFAAGSPATYLKSLRSKGVFLPNYYGTGHASLDNYIAMVSGQPPQPATMGDCLGLSLWTCVQPQGAQAGGRNLADQLDSNHLTWRSYQDGTSTPCFHSRYVAGDTSPDAYQGNSTTGAKNYADRHNPFLYFPDVIGDAARCAAHQRPFTDLAGDLRRDTLPAFSFITPDTCNDGHDNPCSGQKVGGLTTADAWLRTHGPALLTYLAKHNGLLIVNFDEGGAPTSPQDAVANAAEYSCATCVSLGAGGRTGAILVSPRLPQGATVTTSYDHYSLLRTLEDGFGIAEHLGMAGRATAMTAAFRGTRIGR
ncbi:MAG: alkaline phosphatase family protein [Mycobacteriales bacterium]